MFGRSGIFLPLLAAMLCAGVVLGEEIAHIDEEVVEGPIGLRVHRYLLWAEQFGFSGAVLVAMDGDIVLHQAYGSADRRNERRNDIDTVFSFGSITKQFTAAGIMKLEQEGLLDTDDSLTKFFEDVPADKVGITLHHLLTHTAGLVDYHGNFDFQKMSRDTAVKVILSKPLLSQPGEKFAYSNSGYTLAAAIIEHVTGRGYVDFMKSEIFEPAGMTETGFMDEDLWEKGRAARIYRGTIDNGSPPEKPGPFWVLLGNGGVVSTVGQMYRWDRALRTEEILSDDMKKKIFTPFLNDYGYGWDVFTTERGTTKHAHDGGSSLGLSAEFERYIEEDGAFILASNATIGRGLAIEYLVAPVERLIFDSREPLPKPPVLARTSEVDGSLYEGEFRLDKDNYFHIWKEGEQHFFAGSGQRALELAVPELEARREEFDVLNDCALRIVEGIFAGDLNLLEEAFRADDKDPRAHARRWADIFLAWAEKGGKFQRVEILGTRPVWEDSPPDPATWIRVQFKKRTRVWRFHWSEGNLTGLGGEAWPYPFYAPVRFTDTNGALAFSFRSGRAVGLQFHVAKSGAVQGLSLGTSPDTVAAKTKRRAR